MGVGADGTAGEVGDMAAAFISGHTFRATGDRLREERRHARKRRAGGEPCLDPHNAPLRPLRREK
jgi:hypothetical protein